MGDDLPGSERDAYRRAMSQLNRLAGRAWLVLMVERLWPALWPPVGAILLFLAASWFGLWLVLPATVRLVVLVAFALGFIYSLRSIWFLRRPQIEDALRRVDRDSGGKHGQAETFTDKLALGRETAATRELWILHRKRAAAAIPAMKVGAPRPDMPRRDRYALRASVILAVVASAFAAGPEKAERLDAAFQGFGFAGSESSQHLADGWISPPNYTGLPPQVLDFGEERKTLRAPVGSIVVIRTQKEGGTEITAGAGLRQDKTSEQEIRKSADDKLEERRFIVEGTARLSLRNGFFSKAQLDIEAIPDTPPVIAFAGEPLVNNRGALSLAFRGSDDYGIVELKGVTRLTDSNRALVAPPEFSLTQPGTNDASKPLRQTLDLTDHPLAGLPVELTLIARDASGQEGHSQTIALTLPERPFTVPLARALVELRRNLVLNPANRRQVLVGVEALLIAPAEFTPQWGVFMGLREITKLLRSAKNGDDLLVSADWLWAMALQIEDGSLPEAERNLRDAQQKLQEAVERGASEREIAQLSEALREAMNRYLQELAQRMQQGEQTADMPPADMTINSEDLSRMLDKFEQLMRDGKTAEAQQLLDQMRNIFDSLQTGRPNNRATDPMAQEMAQAMKEANRLLQDQRRLRDDTYDRDRKQQLYGEGEQPQQGEEPSLDQRQQALRQQLQDLQRKMRGLGLEEEQGMREAEQAMGDAEQALRQSQGSEAVDAQGRAIEALQRGAQGLAQQGQQMMGNNQPGSNGAGAREGKGFNDATGKANTPGSRERARQLMEQLRNKLSDPTRPKDELDYFERLLRQDR